MSKTKKLLALILAAVMFVCSVSVTASAELGVDDCYGSFSEARSKFYSYNDHSDDNADYYGDGKGYYDKGFVDKLFKAKNATDETVKRYVSIALPDAGELSFLPIEEKNYPSTEWFYSNLDSAYRLSVLDESGKVVAGNSVKKMIGNTVKIEEAGIYTLRFTLPPNGYIRSFGISYSPKSFKIEKVTIAGETYYTNETSIDINNDTELSKKDLKALSKCKCLVRLSIETVYWKDWNKNIFYEDKRDITSLSFLSELKFLQRLEIQNAKISDLNPISNLKDLIYLDLRANSISDIKSLSSLKNLNYLNLEINYIRDISPISKLTNLERLDLDKQSYFGDSSNNDNNKIVNLSPLKNLKNLKNLYVGSNNITDLSPLKNLNNLKELDVSNNNITDLSPLKNLKNLDWLDVGKNKNLTYKNIYSLSSLKNLKYIYAYDIDLKESEKEKLRKLFNIAFLASEGKG